MKLIDFNEQDFERLYAFMTPLWQETYGNILPNEQIEFLLDKYFSPTSIEYYRAQGYRYKKIDDVGVLVFVECENTYNPLILWQKSGVPRSDSPLSFFISTHTW